jgi:hypothetical protein
VSIGDRVIGGSGDCQSNNLRSCDPCAILRSTYIAPIAHESSIADRPIADRR